MLKNFVLDALLTAILLVGKEILAFLPNFEIVTLVLMVITLSLNLKDSLLIGFSFATVENLLYGIGLYTFSYYLAWFLIIIITYGLKDFLKNEYRAAFLSLLFGLLFDLPFSLPYFLMGMEVGTAYLLNGLFFSIVHAIGNFLLALFLFMPLRKLFWRLAK